jgi:hypothetical protein
VAVCFHYPKPIQKTEMSRKKPRFAPKRVAGVELHFGPADIKWNFVSLGGRQNRAADPS